MKTGVLADIHGDITNLTKALDHLRREKVDTIVALGDLIYDRSNASETVELLKGCGAIGVWGNHELGLCVDPDDEIRELYTESVMDFFSTLKSHLEVGQCLFSHTLPHQDATDPVSYCLGAKPDEEDALTPVFSQFSHRIFMAGHFHRWFAATATGPISWDGSTPIKLDSGKRYFFVIHAVMDGYAAILDGDRNLLQPIRL